MYNPKEDDTKNLTGITQGQTRSTSPDERLYPIDPSPAKRSKDPRMDLDGEDVKNLHSSLMGHFLREMAIQGPNRMEMAIDEEFYDNNPYSPEERAALIRRGQIPVNFGIVATIVNWVIGTQRRNRTDYKILPRRKVGVQHADRKTQLMKYLSDTNHSGYGESKAFASSVKAGIGWLECGWQNDDEGEPIYDRPESWRNVLHDSLAQQDDFEDGRYIFRVKWADVDVAIDFFNDRGATILSAAHSVYDTSQLSGESTYGDEHMDMREYAAEILTSYRASNEFKANRPRVRLIECWFRKPAKSKFMSGGDFAGEIFDEFSDGHKAELDTGRAQIKEKVKMKTFVAIMTTTGVLHLSESPYRHGRYPLTPILAYRRGADGQPYGLIRNIRDLVRSINKSAMKAQHILASNKTIMEEGVVDDIEQYAEEASRADAVIVVKAGMLGKIKMDVDRELATAHTMMVDRMIELVQSSSGVTDENLGRKTNAVSGKAIVARQDQGSLATAELFDNLSFARQIHGEKKLSLIEQFFGEYKEFRITNARGDAKYIEINNGMPENDITRTKADFIITEQQWNATQKQQAVQDLMSLIKEVAPAIPQFPLQVLDLLVEMMDLPSKDEIVKRIRQVTKMKDPDADPDAPPTDEEMMEAKADQAAQAMQARAADAEISKAEAEAERAAALAAKARADVTNIMAGLRNKSLADQDLALETALKMFTVPQIASLADNLMQAAAESALAGTGGVMPEPMPADMPPPQQPPQQQPDMAQPQPAQVMDPSQQPL